MLRLSLSLFTVFIVGSMNPAFVVHAAVPASAARETELTYPNPTCVCDLNKKDPYEEPQSFNFGKFKDQCVDSCRFRRVIILSQETSQTNMKKHNKEYSQTTTPIITVGNILHFGEFYTSQIHLHDLESIRVGFEEFFPTVHHVFLEFQFKETASPLTLSPQTSLGSQPLSSSHSIKTRTLVISPEGVQPQRHKYSLWEGYQGYYLLMGRLVTGEEMNRVVQKFHHPVKRFFLQITPSLAQQIFLKGLQESERMSTKMTYHLFSQNCSTAVLSYIDAALHPPQTSPSSTSTAWTKFEEALPITGPLGTLRALRKRQLVDDHQTL